jgi:hypothetical protein
MYNDFLSTTRSRLYVHMYVLSKDFISTQKTEMRKQINFAQLMLKVCATKYVDI